MAQSITGTYKYDPKLGRVVKVSDRVPGLKKSGGGSSDPGAEVGPCGRSECGGGTCAGMGG